MKRTLFLMSLTLAVGLATGTVGARILSAQQPEIKRTELLRTELPGVEGKEAIIFQGRDSAWSRDGQASPSWERADLSARGFLCPGGGR
jgi:hypothetical protein